MYSLQKMKLIENFILFSACGATCMIVFLPLLLKFNQIIPHTTIQTQTSWNISCPGLRNPGLLLQPIHQVPTVLVMYRDKIYNVTSYFQYPVRIFDSNMDQILVTQNTKIDRKFDYLMQQDPLYYSNVLNCMNNLFLIGGYTTAEGPYDVCICTAIFWIVLVCIQVRMKFVNWRYILPIWVFYVSICIMYLITNFKYIYLICVLILSSLLIILPVSYSGTFKDKIVYCVYIILCPVLYIYSFKKENVEKAICARVYTTRLSSVSDQILFT